MDNTTITASIVTGLFTLAAIWYGRYLNQFRRSTAQGGTSTISLGTEILVAVGYIMVCAIVYYGVVTIFGNKALPFVRLCYIIWNIVIAYFSWTDDSRPRKMAAVIVGAFSVYLIWLFRSDLMIAAKGLVEFFSFGK